MRQKITLGVLLVFCLTEMRPLYTFVQYYVDYDYITEVLCINKDKPMTRCNGKCYLRLELEKAQPEKETSSTLPVIEWGKIPMVTFESSFSPHKNLILLSQIKRIPFYILQAKDIFLSPDTPPPQSMG